MLNVNHEMRQMRSVDMSSELSYLFDSLLVTLRSEIGVYKELKDTVLTEKEVLKKYSVEELIESNSKKETVILKAKMLEEVKLNIVRKIAKEVGISDRSVNISALIRYADADTKKALKAYQMALRIMTEEIHRINRSNMELMSMSLQSVVGSINFLNNLVFSGETYAGSGKMTQMGSQGRLLSTEG
jgi:hypothetical protein